MANGIQTANAGMGISGSVNMPQQQ